MWKQALKHGVQSTIKEIKSSLLPGKDNVALYHRGQCLSLGGRTLFAAKIKLFQFIGGYPRHKRAPVT